ncbi:MAG: hypothetical protein U9Q71_03360, partial [Pseudomonadota bacterium]|nr:hypothetical protein [Pseudomonadota bacterium]
MTLPARQIRISQGGVALSTKLVFDFGGKAFAFGRSASANAASTLVKSGIVKSGAEEQVLVTLEKLVID